jgi:NADH:ubiquinone oxidoreductase subunit 6 (subunit J)
VRLSVPIGLQYADLVGALSLAKLPTDIVVLTLCAVLLLLQKSSPETMSLSKVSPVIVLAVFAVLLLLLIPWLSQSRALAAESAKDRQNR